MASESESAATEASSFVENLINARNRDLSLFLPFILAFTNSSISTTPVQDSTDPDQETQESTTPSDFLDRIILINPFTQGMVVIQNRSSSSNFESFLSDLLGKDGQPPASKASIEALPNVEICENGECVICLEEWGVGGGDVVVKEMPCKHRFHGNCIEKWLKIHGSCPVCRYKMPEEEGDLNNKSENRGRRREIWLSFGLGNDRRSENNQTVSANSSSENEHDHEPEV
ncbi:PREDICTED: E3 ubiquitin-protein ligase RING1-like [Nicotiana attenuata]|uniref:RING-type E3 ubiquitin transferase n=1 Tax=Nicotiana attenuata TaxID=49451 RepID=A0A1J6KU66_NICAT|nr:PREDICTED: E3 ubiquitin-protein ligase RING1-like [Nicotiana attenuata]OIT28304.1 e3 ubiquitin-protein ligase ring1-like protein [Nicotiana attenuata]